MLKVICSLHRDYIVFHLIGRGIRWHAGDEPPSNEEQLLLELFVNTWLKLFGPMKVYMVDG